MSVPLSGAPLSGDIETEVVVAGAGAAGLAVALALAEAGRAVTILEQRSVASGLSGRGAGAILASSGHWLVRDERDCGLESARARRALAVRGRAHAHALTHGARAIDCALDASGSTLLALSPREWADAVRTHALLTEAGDRVELLDRSTAHHRAAAGLFAGGLHDPDDFALDPAAFLRGLAHRAVARGARLHEGTPVTAYLEPTAGGVVVHTPRGTVRAAMLVIAMNAWTPALVPAMTGCIVPHRAQALLTEPLSGPIPPGTWITNHGHEHWRRLDSGAVLFSGCRETSPATESVLSEESTGKIQGMMERFISKAFPALAEPTVTHRWAAAAATTCDGLPIIGPPPGASCVMVCCGFDEHELALALGAGMTTADLVQAGRVESAEPFSARRFV